MVAGGWIVFSLGSYGDIFDGLCEIVDGCKVLIGGGWALGLLFVHSAAIMFEEMASKIVVCGGLRNGV